MRTKHLLTAMVLPALFAACTNEELDVVNNVESLDSRAVVENVKLTVGETVDSRLVYDGGYSFQVGDQLGAALMDEITESYWNFDAKWSQRFELTDYIQTNYKFTKTGEEWETEAKLCEGNYFFAYPYNMNQGLRQAYAFSCEDQVLEGTDKASLMKAYVANNSFVGYGKVERSNEEGESVAVPMVPVFGATGIILTNRGTEERTIEKVVLRGNKVTTLAVVAPDKFDFDVDEYAANLKDGSDDAKKANDEALAGIIEYSTPKNDENEDNDFIEVYIKSGNTISDGESINVIVMSGLAEIAKGDVLMDVYSTRGVIRGIDLASLYTAKDQDDIVTDNELTALGAGQKIEVEFSHSTFEVQSAFDVYSDDDLAELIKWNAEAKTKREIIATLKANVTLSKAMYDKLVSTEMITKATIVSDGYELTIAKDVPADAIDKLNLNGGRVMILGEQTVAGNNTLNAKLQVAKGAVLTLKRSLPTRNHVNYGTLNLAANNLRIDGQVYNFGGEINVIAAATIGTLENHEGTINNKSTLTITVGKNNGVINNEGTLNAAAFVNAVKETTDCGYCKVKHAAGTVKNAGKILALTNNSLVEMLSAEARATVTGDGQIDNTIQSSYVTGGDNTIFVKVADLKASELAEIIVNAGATKVKASGTITVDPAENETTVSLKDNLTIEATAKLTIAGKGKLYAKKANLEIAKNVEVLIKNGASLSLDGGSAKAIAAPAYLTIENGGKFYGTVGTSVTVEDYSK